jgi:hypothetical protein
MYAAPPVQPMNECTPRSHRRGISGQLLDQRIKLHCCPLRSYSAARPQTLQAASRTRLKACHSSPALPQESASLPPKPWRAKARGSSSTAHDRDTDRALDSMERLLAAVSAPQADEVNRMKLELRRLTFDEQVRNEKRKAGGSLIEPTGTGNLKPRL